MFTMGQVSEASSRTTTVVGIDEAGYGPLLGPLVVSAVAFDVPVALMKSLDDAAAGPNLWEVLRASVSESPKKRDPRLAIADSKKLHGKASKTAGIRLIEQAVLAFLAQQGPLPDSLQGLLSRVAGRSSDGLSRYPWYTADAVPVPYECTSATLATQAHALGADLAANGMRFRGAWVEVLPEGHYNDLVERTHNKATVLFDRTTRLIQRVADHVGNVPLRVWVDRQGGRITYRRGLMRAFPDAELDVLEESPERSSYRLGRPNAPQLVRFVMKGESHHMQIALASLFSKYLRELFMLCLNRYWAAEVADLRPTAGYYTDGKRFLADIEPALVRQKIDRRLLVRSS